MGEPRLVKRDVGKVCSAEKDGISLISPNLFKPPRYDTTVKNYFYYTEIWMDVARAK